MDIYLIPDLDRSPYVFIHGDISPNNIIVDSEYNVKRYATSYSDSKYSYNTVSLISAGQRWFHYNLPQAILASLHMSLLDLRSRIEVQAHLTFIPKIQRS